MAGGEIMAEADDLVDEEGGRIRRDPPRRGVSQQPELNLGAAGFQSLFEQIDHRAAALAGIACFTGDLIEPRRPRAAVADPAAVFKLFEAIAYVPSASNPLSEWTATTARPGRMDESRGG